jgi:hypothetical protein
MRKFTLSFLLTFGFISIFAQVSSHMLWQKCIGGSGAESAWSIKPTSDRGFIISGYALSSNGNVTVNHGEADFWVVKTNESGEIQWQKSYGGSAYDIAHSGIQTNDGGYIFAGYTYSNDGDVTGNHGDSDCWIVKTDESGEIEWKKCYGGLNLESASSIIQTADGGYIIAATCSSNNGDVTTLLGHHDMWIVKIDASGTIQWQHSYGGNGWDYTYCIIQTDDGGYIFTGFTESNNGDVTVNYGRSDVWVVKINQIGTLEWQKSYGGSQDDYGTSICKTSDGGYVLAATSESNDYDLKKNNGFEDFWLVRITSTGEILWQKSYGGTYEDRTTDVIQTNDGGYLITGQTFSYDKDITGSNGASDAWLVKTDSSGNIQWERAMGGSSQESMESVIQTADGVFVTAGFTASNNGNVTGFKGATDLWLVRLCTIEALALSVNDPEYCVSAEISATPGFDHYVWNTGDTTQSILVFSGGYYNVVAASGSSECESVAEIMIPQMEGVFNYEGICMVTVDELSGKNMIQVHKTINVGTDSILIFRADSLNGQYRISGSIAFDALNVFVDEYALPDEHTYSYKIACKNYECISDLSEPHHAIFLAAEYDSSNSKQVKLTWTNYFGAGHNEIQVFRSNAGGEFEFISNVDANADTYTDLSAPSGTNSYVLRVPFATACASAKTDFAYSSSNVVHAGTYGMNEYATKQISIYPNPASNELNVEIKDSNHTYIFELLDLTGRVLQMGRINEFTKIDLSALTKGIYMIKIIGDFEQTFKIVKE